MPLESVDLIIQRDQTAFYDWLSQTQPRSLDMPLAAIRYLIPPALYHQPEIAPKEITIFPYTNDSTFLDVFVGERRSEPVCDLAALEAHHKEISRIRNLILQGEDEAFPPTPPNVDHFLNEYYEELIEEKFLDPYTFITNHIALVAEDDVLEVGSYGDRENWRRRGIATSFYSRLRECALALGFKYIVGQNFDHNVTFYTDRLGRVKWHELKSETLKDKLNPLRSHHRLESPNFTVDFLDPIERAQYEVGIR